MAATKETKAMSHGIKTSIGTTEVPVFPNRLEEVSKFDPEQYNNGGLPFVGHEKQYREYVRLLKTKYPYVNLEGETGIGKTLMILHSTGVITGKIPIAEVENTFPDLVDDFKSIKDKVKLFQHRDYILFPNLHDPMSYEALHYVDADASDLDLRIGKQFCEDVATVLSNYAMDNRKNIRLLFTDDEFKEYMRFRVNEIHVKINEKAAEITCPEKKNQSQQEDFALITLSPPEKPTNTKIKTEWKFIQKPGDKKPNTNRYKAKAGYGSAMKNLTLEKLEDGLANSFVLNQAEPLIANLLWELRVLDIEGKDDEKYKFEVLQEEFKEYVEKTIKPIKQDYLDGNIFNQRGMVSELKTSGPSLTHGTKISPRTIEDIVGKVKTVRNKFDPKKGYSEELGKRMDSVVSYVEYEHDALERTVKDMLEQIRELEEKKPPQIRNSGKKKKDSGSDIEEKRDTTYKDVKFKLRYGKYEIDIKDIMQVNSFRDPLAFGGVTVAEVREFDYNHLFGTFIEDDPKEPTPPHMQLATLGQMFKGGILVFPDCFDDYIQFIAGSNPLGGETDTRNLRELTLDHLQSHNLTIIHEGITFKFKAPRMIIGSSNVPPFVSRHGLYERNEDGLEDRITSMEIHHIAENTEEARRGTLYLLHNVIKDYNKDSKKKIESLEPEAAHMILRTMEVDEHLGLIKYRKFSQQIEKLCAYASSKGESKITPEIMKLREMDLLPPDFFHRVDHEASEYDGYFKLPEKQAGYVNGLTIMCDGIGARARLQSTFVPDVDPLPHGVKRFELTDIPAGLVDETTYKGFELATDYIKKFIFEIRKNDPKVLPKDEGWQVKIQFDRWWQPGGGPSASFAQTIAMLSALSGQEVYRNRFFTGTIDPANGNAGIIGGTYQKGLIPMRLQELSKESGEEFYFMFPAPNLKDLTQEIIFDPFKMEEKITGIPIANIGQAFYLATCGPHITEKQWQNSFEKGDATLKEVKEKIKKLHT